MKDKKVPDQSFFLQSSGRIKQFLYISLIFISGFTSSIQAQDPIFSQFYLSPLQLNPGLSGLSDEPRFAANYRNQYPGFNNAYRTYALSYDQFFPDFNGGVGGWILSDDAGDGILKTLKVAGIFSYRVRLINNLFLKTGIEAGIVQSTLNWNQLIFGDQIDAYVGKVSPGGIPFPTEETAPDKNKVIYPDLGFGMVVYGGELYAGASLRHLNRPDPNFLSINSNLTPRIPMRLTLHAGSSWPLFERMLRSFEVSFSPSVIFVKQGPFNQFNGGFTIDADVITLGAHYRLSSGDSEAIIGSIGFRTNHLRVGYSFDYTVSGFPLSGGTHEIGIVYDLDDGDNGSRYNDCFNLFR